MESVFLCHHVHLIVRAKDSENSISKSNRITKKILTVGFVSVPVWQ